MLVCLGCNALTTRPGRCLSCGADLLVFSGKSAPDDAPPAALRTLADAQHFALRHSATPLGQALGGKLPCSGVVLVSGLPGGGKSSAAALVAIEAARARRRVVWCSAEMSDAQTRDLFEFLGASSSDLRRVGIAQVHEPSDVERYAEGAGLVVVDSLHAIATWAQRAPQLLAWRRSARCLWIVVCQSNARGKPNGGNALIHNAHAACVAEKGGFRVLRSGWSAATE